MKYIHAFLTVHKAYSNILGKFGKLGGEKSCIVVYGSARSSKYEAHGPSATATI